MLVLARHKDETIVINGNIRVTIVQISADKVRLGIEAPREVTVHRLEIQDQIDKEIAAGVDRFGRKIATPAPLDCDDD